LLQEELGKVEELEEEKGLIANLMQKSFHPRGAYETFR
jgi:hypothetical protein